jgi:hypothetical protein
MRAGKLTPLGNAAANAPEWFATVEIVQLALDREWLHRAYMNSLNTGGVSGNAVVVHSETRTTC